MYTELNSRVVTRAVAYMADGQPSALWTGRHSGRETSEGLPGEKKLYVRRSNMRSESYHDDRHTFRRETERSEHCGIEGWICTVTDCRCRHDMMNMQNIIFGALSKRLLTPIPNTPFDPPTRSNRMNLPATPQTNREHITVGESPAGTTVPFCQCYNNSYVRIVYDESMKILRHG